MVLTFACTRTHPHTHTHTHTHTGKRAIKICQLGLTAIVGAMKAHGRTATSAMSSAAVSVQENGAGLLWSLAFAGGTCLVLHVVWQSHSHVGSSFSHSHTLPEACGESVWRAGGVDRVLECMEDYPDSVVLQENCCGAIWNLSAKADHKVILGDRGAVELILRAMVRHAGRVTLQKNALAALWDLNFLTRTTDMHHHNGPACSCSTPSMLMDGQLVHMYCAQVKTSYAFLVLVASSTCLLP